MDTIKTAFVVALLLAVLYGVYVVLNKEPATTPHDVVDMLTEADNENLLDDGPEIDSGVAEDDSAADIQDGVEEGQPEEVPSPGEFNYRDRDAAPSESEKPIDDTGAETAPINPPRSRQFNPEPPADDLNNTSPRENEQNPSLEGADVPGDSQQQSYVERGINDPANLGTTPGATSNEEGSPSADGSSVYSPGSTASTAFDDIWNKAQAEIQEGKLAEALATATSAYNNDLSVENRKQLEDLLDPLAAKVIYSREPYLEPLYTARGGETLMDIAEKYQVPWQLLQNINGVENPEVLLPGTSLKVVKGPFRAEVDTQRGELTLYLQQMYAGRFVITVGNEPAPQPGAYWVITKEEGHTYYTKDNRSLQPNDPLNPYGDVWIALGNNVCIHGSAGSGGSNSGAGCISLSPQQARDVYGILIEGSKVEILP